MLESDSGYESDPDFPPSPECSFCGEQVGEQRCVSCGTPTHIKDHCGAISNRGLQCLVCQFYLA